jgi:hypothetical protein
MNERRTSNFCRVSVAGCLGYDVLDIEMDTIAICCEVSVAGCLGYDVLDFRKDYISEDKKFQYMHQRE